jgi:hypothetical protein
MHVFTDYRGRQIRLTDERLAHICEHPEMLGRESELADVLTRPDLVTQSVSDPQVHLYYRRLPAARTRARWLCIVAKVMVDNGFIIPAYLTDRPKRGPVLWRAGQ